MKTHGILQRTKLVILLALRSLARRSTDLAFASILYPSRLHYEARFVVLSSIASRIGHSRTESPLSQLPTSVSSAVFKAVRR